MSALKSTTLTTRTLIPGTYLRSSHAVAHVSMVGTSPAHASTTSGSPPPSLVANFQVDAPREQCSSASSIVSHCSCGCLPQVTMLTLLRLRRQWSKTLSRQLASGG